MSSLSDEEIWTSGDNEIIKLYNLKGEVLESIQTKSGYGPRDIAVTQSGGLVYAYCVDSSINVVSGTKIQTLITLRGWRSLGLCSTSSGDLLVIMDSDDDEQRKLWVILAPQKKEQFSGTTKVSCSIHLVTLNTKG